MRAGDIMIRGVVTIDEHVSLAEAAGRLDVHPESTLHVVDGVGHLVGLITAAQVLERIAPAARDDAKSDRTTVADAMSAPVLVVRSDTDIRAVAAVLAETGTWAVTVVDGFTPVGTVTRRELRRALTGAEPPPWHVA